MGSSHISAQTLAWLSRQLPILSPPSESDLYLVARPYLNPGRHRYPHQPPLSRETGSNCQLIGFANMAIRVAVSAKKGIRRAVANA